LNDVRNLDRAVSEVKACGKHAEATLCYTVSPVHSIDRFVDLARKLEDLGTDTICIKDMAGLLEASTCSIPRSLRWQGEPLIQRRKRWSLRSRIRPTTRDWSSHPSSRSPSTSDRFAANIASSRATLPAWMQKSSCRRFPAVCCRTW